VQSTCPSAVDAANLSASRNRSRPHLESRSQSRLGCGCCPWSRPRGRRSVCVWPDGAARPEPADGPNSKKHRPTDTWLLHPLTSAARCSAFMIEMNGLPAASHVAAIGQDVPMPDLLADADGEFSLHAWVDGSMRIGGTQDGLYVLAAVVCDPARCDRRWLPRGPAIRTNPPALGLEGHRRDRRRVRDQ